MPETEQREDREEWVLRINIPTTFREHLKLRTYLMRRKKTICSWATSLVRKEILKITQGK